MPQLRTYEVQLPDGRTIEIQSASPPTAEQVMKAQAALTPIKPPPSAWDQSIFGPTIPGPSFGQVGKFALEALPSVGAATAVGGLTGGAGFIPALLAAGAGGAAGTAARDVVKAGATQDPVPTTPAAVVAEMGKSGGEQVLAEAGGRGIVKGAKALAPVIKSSAQRGYAKVFGATPGKAAAYEKVVPEMLERGIHGTEGSLVEQGRKGLQGAADALNDTLNQLAPGTQVNTADILGRLEEAKQRFTTTAGVIMSKSRQKALAKAGGPPPQQPFAQIPDKESEKAVEALEELQGAIEAHGPYVTFNTLRNLRQVWDTAVAEAGGYAGKSLKEASRLNAKKVAANSIREEFAKSFPDIARVNAEYSFWKRVEGLLEERAKKQLGGGSEAMGYGGYVMAGGVAHGNIPSAGMTVATLHTLRSVFNSPVWATTSGVWKNRLADLIAAGSEKQATQVASNILRFPTFYQELGSVRPGDVRPNGPLLTPPPPR